MLFDRNGAYRMLFHCQLSYSQQGFAGLSWLTSEPNNGWWPWFAMPRSLWCLYKAVLLYGCVGVMLLGLLLCNFHGFIASHGDGGAVMQGSEIAWETTGLCILLVVGLTLGQHQLHASANPWVPHCWQDWGDQAHTLCGSVLCTQTCHQGSSVWYSDNSLCVLHAFSQLHPPSPEVATLSASYILVLRLQPIPRYT